jgi:hypothetical protein
MLPLPPPPLPPPLDGSLGRREETSRVRKRAHVAQKYVESRYRKLVGLGISSIPKTHLSRFIMYLFGIVTTSARF